jgi:hypothetical protein
VNTARVEEPRGGQRQAWQICSELPVRGSEGDARAHGMAAADRAPNQNLGAANRADSERAGDGLGSRSQEPKAASSLISSATGRAWTQLFGCLLSSSTACRVGLAWAWMRPRRRDTGHLPLFRLAWRARVALRVYLYGSSTYLLYVSSALGRRVRRRSRSSLYSCAPATARCRACPS